MKFRNEIFRIRKIGGGFPRIFRDGIAFPFNEIKQTMTTELRIEDFFDFIFRLVIDDNGGRRRLSPAGNIGFDISIKQRNMKHGVDFERHREL